MTKHPRAPTKAFVEIDITVIDVVLSKTNMSGGSVSYLPQVMLARTRDHRSTPITDFFQILERPVDVVEIWELKDKGAQPPCAPDGSRP